MTLCSQPEVAFEEVLVEIQAGEGGQDSRIFVHELFSAYVRWAARLGLKAEVVEATDSRAAGHFSGPGAAAAFEHESGKHCVQRIPPTERSGRHQTSMVAVSVSLIQAKPSVQLRDADLDVTFQTGSGPGGQHRNKTQSACRARHKPTGLQVFIDGRDQHANRRLALRILASRVQALAKGKAHAAANERKRQHWDGGGRSNKIRTYNFLDSRAVDHRTGAKTRQVREVLKGRFDLLRTETARVQYGEKQ